jgi:hypothetical protein
MQPPADFHGQIADPGFSEATGIVPATAAVDAAVDRFEADEAPGNAPMRGVLGPRQHPAPRLVRRHDRLDLVERERQEAAILEQPTARWQGGRGGLGHPFVMAAPSSTVDLLRGIGVQQDLRMPHGRARPLGRGGSGVQHPFL